MPSAFSLFDVGRGPCLSSGEYLSAFSFWPRFRGFPRPVVYLGFTFLWNRSLFASHFF